MEFFDSHAHYNDEQFDSDRQQIINKTYEDGITKFMCAGYSLESSKKALEIANSYDFIYTISGVSPNDVKATIDETRQDIEKIKSLK